MAFADLPPLSSYDVYEKAPLLSFVSDKALAIMLPPISYAVFSILWEWIDRSELLTKYKLYPPEEMTKRNRISKWECLRGVVAYHVMQIAVTVALTWNDDGKTYGGQEQFYILRWASKLRILQHMLPSLLALFGVDSLAWSSKVQATSPTLSAVLSGGDYTGLKNNATATGSLLAQSVPLVQGFAPWEIVGGKALYYILVPAFQLWMCFFIADTWFYFGHRMMHNYKWLYKNFHSMHHRLYITYAFGAVYSHPVEGFLVDTIAFTLGVVLSNLSIRQGMVFNVLATWKALVDHCGYALPWDPFELVTAADSKFHDVHHQTWGLKSNFALFFTFWDQLLGTAKESRYGRETMIKADDKIEE
ncbi:hypothetical protein ASPZODRAFT_92448 [Penicilliopsis zonata CBS 506.65]|uniref:Fatty acid hydroxylase domain-containing protein n=1 Tax=Penicilliopsis zonata CBS 506.65 TaxID=1073090 RepID=A0A1L9SLJ0_9EURO|nr:hypothetical protein ASPZODRAFT_92448 [Penicilliopsis zonata CBS 506.65]OJJ48142.1 hypothetical protein ASPZODRAFT_92448 [Penicilliopsis zonata CBS 506.65]